GVYRLTVSGERHAAITIDIGDVSTGSPHLRLNRFKGIYAAMPIHDFPSPTLPLPGAEGAMLYLGARATVNSAMPPGGLSPTFDIDVIVN
ncbi:MAG: hypothetical protein AB7H77_03085, partial [Bdellovibrionales bacterium]